jgi:hypothetical protein
VFETAPSSSTIHYFQFHCSELAESCFLEIVSLSTTTTTTTTTTTNNNNNNNNNNGDSVARN